MNKYSRVLNKAFSLLALVSLALMQAIPISTTAASPAFDQLHACGTGQTLLLMCFPDGSDPVHLPNRIQVFPAGGGTPLPEADNDGLGNPIGGTAPSLKAHVGDTVRVPFEFADLGCPNIPVFSPILNINPQGPNAQPSITPTQITWGNGANGLLQVAGATGPGPLSPLAVNTAYGYFQFVVQAGEGVPDSLLGNIELLNFQLDTGGAGYKCGSTQEPHDNINLTGKDLNGVSGDTAGYSSRRVQIAGAAFTFTPGALPNHVSQGNSVKIPVTVTNIGNAASFSLTTQVTPVPSGSNNPNVAVNYDAAISGTFNLAANGTASGNVTVGPFPANYPPNVQIVITATGTIAPDSSTEQISVPLPVLSPQAALTVTSTSNHTGNPNLYAPGDTATYTVTLSNISNYVNGNVGFSLSACSVVDSLGGLVTMSPATIPPGAASNTATGTFTHLITSSDPNPLTDTVTANCTGTSPDTPATTAGVFASNTYSLPVESANLNVSLAVVTPPATNPTPNYAKPGTPIAGTLSVINTGTQDITITSASVQLIDPNTSAQYGNAPITNLPSTIPAGVTVSPAPAFSITPTSIPANVFGVNLVITIDGISSQSVHVHRQIVFPMDVVTSALHVIVTTDAPSNVVVLGQTIHYTIAVQNISGGTVNGIQISQLDTLQLLTPLPINIPALASGATYTLPTSYAYTVTGNSKNPLKEAVTVNFSGGGPAVGQSVLNYSNTQLFVGVTAACVVGTSSCTPISNNQVQAGVKVRYSVLVQDVGPSTVNNVVACLGNAICKSGDPAAIVLMSNGSNFNGTLYSLGAPATNQQVDVTIPASQNGPFTQVVTVTGSDQLGATVVFRGSSTLAVISPNVYWQATKTANVTTAYVGDTITYNVQVCYNPTQNATNPPAQVVNVQASDPLIPAPHFVKLVIPGGTPGGTTSPQPLPKGQCATGTYNYIPDGSLLGGQPGPVQLTNTVTFNTSDTSVGNTSASVVISLLNPLKVTKTVVSPPTPATVFSGDPVQYSYSFTNLSTNPITLFSAADSPAGNNFQPALPGTLNPGQSVSATITTHAPGTSGPAGLKLTNVVTANGTIGSVTVSGTATATVQVNPALTVTKQANPPDPFQYDPKVTYTITITNHASVPITLTDANDSMGGLATPLVGKAGPFVVGGVNHTLPYDLASGATATLTYTASPAAILLTGTNPYTNTFTLSAQTPAPDNSPITAKAQATIAIFQPIGFSACPQYTYYGWGETSHWTVKAYNFSDPSNPVSITNLKMDSAQLGINPIPLNTNTLPGPTPPGQPAVANFDYVIPWNTTLTSFDSVTIHYSYDFTLQGQSPVHIDSSFAVGDLGCAKRKIGPPLTITKVPNKTSSSGVGDVITYTVTVTNPMMDPADTVSGISATDLTFGSVLTLTKQTLGTGESATATFQHTVTASDPTPLINTVSVNGTLGGKTFPAPLTAQATVLLPTPAVKLTLTTDASTYNPGDTITYSVTIQNTSQNSVKLQTAAANPDGVAPNDASTGFTNWLATPAANGGVLPAGSSVTIPNLYKIVSSTNLAQTGSFSSTLTINYSVQTTPAQPGTSSATATVTILNPYLQVTITSVPSVVVNYGQTVTYTETVLNPEPINSPGAVDSNLTVTHTLLSQSDVVGHWLNSSGGDLGAGTPPTLAPGVSIHRFVTHNVTTADFSPLTFKVKATATFTPASGPPIQIQTTQIDTLIISSAQLLMFASPQKTTVRAGDTDDITLTMTNIGPTAIDLLNVTAQLNDGSAAAPISTLPSIPGGASPGNQLTQFAAASADDVLTIPATLPNNYPNPLIVTFTASGTAGGTPFNNVVLTVLIHVLNNGNIQITEAPQVSAAALGSNVNYNITVFNTGTVPLNVTGVTDQNTNQPVSLVFTSGGQPTTTGTIQPGGSAAGVTTAQIKVDPVTKQVPNPFVHTTKATGTAGAATVSDTSASTVNVLGGTLSVTYSAPSSQVPLNQKETFTLTVTNVSQALVSNVVAKDTDSNTPITLKNGQGQTITSLAPGASATGLNVLPATRFAVAGPVTSNVSVTGTDVNNNPIVANQSATVIAVGAGIAFATPPVANPPSAAVGQTVTFSFTLKNTSMQATDDLTNISVICQGTSNCGTLTPPLASLAHGTVSPTESITYTVQPTDTGTVTLTFTAAGVGGSPPVTVTANAIGQFNVAVGGLVLTKIANPTSGKPGDTITYTVTLKNTNAGNAVVNGLVDTLLGDIKSKLNTTTIGAGATATASYQYQIPATAPPTLTNTVTATFTTTTQFTSTATANVTVLPIGSGALQVSVTPSVSAAAVGSSVTFAIVIKNTGTSDINLTGISSSLGVNTIISNPLLTAGSTVTLVSNAYTIPAGATGAITNVVTVNGIVAASNTAVQATASCSVTIIGAGGLSVTKTANITAAAVGTNVVYTIQVGNYGTAPLTIVGVFDNLLGSQNSLNNVTLAPNTLAPPIVVSRTILATDPQDIRNTVTVSAKDAANTGYTATAYADVLVTNSSTGLIILGTPNQIVAQPTDTLTYSVRVANILPPSSPTSVSINGISASATLAGNAPQTITLGQTSLQPGQETFGTFQFALSSVATPPNPFILTLNAVGTDSNNLQYTATSQTPPVAIVSPGATFAALLIADKNSIPAPGGKIDYTLTVTNVGTNALTGLSAKINTTSSNLTAAGIPANPYGALPGSLGIGGSTALTFAYTVQTGDPTGGKALTNATDVTGGGATTTVTNVINAQSGPTVTNLTLTCSPPSASCVVKPGDTLALTANVANTGTGPLTNLKYLLNGAPISPIPTGWPTSLVAGQSVNLLPAYNYSVPKALPASDPVSLTLVVNATAGATPVSGTSNAVSYTVINPVLTLTGGITSSQPAALGTTVNFSFTLTNTSTTIPGSGGGAPTITFSQINSNPAIQMMIGSKTVYPTNPPGSLTPSQSAPITLTYTVQPTDPSLLSYTITAVGCPYPGGCTQINQTYLVATSGTLQTTNVTTPTPSPTPNGGGAGLAVTKTANANNVAGGQAVIFTITVTNNTASVQNGVALTDTLPSTLTAGTATTSVGAATVTGSTLTVAIGTLIIGQSATITFNTTVGSSVSAPATIVNSGCATTTTITTPVCASATLTVGANASTLPVTGFGGPSNGGALGGLLWIGLMLSSLLVFGMAAGRGSKGGGSGNQTLLFIIGAIVGIIVLVLVVSIVSSVINKARTAPAATQTQVAANATAIVVTQPPKTPAGPPTVTSIPPPTLAPTYTPAPTQPIQPGPSPTPLPFQPVGARSFYMARLQQGGAIPIVDLPLVNGTWDVNPLGHSVGHLQDTSWVGPSGNTVLVAHIQLTATDFGPFLRLREVQPGDIAYIADNGQVYEYQVTGTTTVDPTDVQVTYPTVDPELTLITCTGWDNNHGAYMKRFVVTAKLLGPVSTPTVQPQA